MKLAFKIEQVALRPRNPAAAIALLTAIGLGTWARDHVVAHGSVLGVPEQTNEADLAFNYEATRGLTPGERMHDDEVPIVKPLELEVLHYTEGNNWCNYHEPSVSHLAMHCDADELAAWDEKFKELGIGVAQEVETESHTNPVIAGKRTYTYVIFNTRAILGVDLKFIVRHDAEQA